MGLFVMVGALVKVGVIDGIATWLADTVGGSPALAADRPPARFGLLSAVIDNIPYVATMSPVVAQLVAPDGPLAGHTELWWALALGADLGGNATAVGASANVVVIGIAQPHGVPDQLLGVHEVRRGGGGRDVALALPYLLLRYL